MPPGGTGIFCILEKMRKKPGAEVSGLNDPNREERDYLPISLRAFSYRSSPMMGIHLS